MTSSIYMSPDIPDKQMVELGQIYPHSGLDIDGILTIVNRGDWL